MTFDLGVWKSNEHLSAAAASSIYALLCRNEQPSEVVSAPSTMADFYNELVATWPEVPAKPSKLRAPLDSPWAGPLHQTDHALLLSCEWRHAEIVLAFVSALASRHGLIVFDPQSEDVYLPEG